MGDSCRRILGEESVTGLPGKGECAKHALMHDGIASKRDETDSQWLSWREDKLLRAACSACGTRGKMPEKVAVRNPFKGAARILYVQCPTCRSLPASNFETPEYRDEDVGGAALKFAKEQGAGIAVMTAPLYWIERGAVSRFLDVGGGYGFALDAARTLFGWEVRGADPSPFGRIGGAELDLEIEDRYVSAGSPAQGAPYDLVLASEVIEHVTDPVAFAQALRACAGPQGRVLLTTPDAKAALDRSDPAGALMALAPGYHAMLYSADGLERILRAAGFAFVSITERSGNLVAAAGAAPFKVDPGHGMPRDDYARYLKDRAATVEADSDLQCGLLARLLREDADAARWAAVRHDLDQLGGLLQRRYGIALFQPQDWVDPEADSFDAFARTVPFCLASIFFALGLHRLLGEGDRTRAEPAFAAAHRAAKATRAALQSIGADDLDLRSLEQRARVQAIQASAWRDVSAAAVAFLPLWREADSHSADDVETLMQIAIVGARVHSEAVNSILDAASAWLRPVAFGARDPASPSERAAVSALLQRAEWLDRPEEAQIWAQTARRVAASFSDAIEAQAAHERLGLDLEARTARRDLDRLTACAESDAHAEAQGEAARVLMRGPGHEALGEEDRIAFALWCLAYADRPESALAFLNAPSRPDGGPSSGAEPLIQEARRRLDDPAYVLGRLTTLAAQGDWHGLRDLLLVAVLPELAEMSPDSAFAFAMYQLNAADDPDSALGAFERAQAARDPALAASAEVHRALCLARTGRGGEAASAAQDMLEALNGEPEGAFAAHAPLLRSLATQPSDQAPL